MGGGRGRKTMPCATMVEKEPGPGVSFPRGWNLSSCNYGDARERKRETVFGHQANSQQRCPTWGGGEGGGARMATPGPPQASLVWLSPGSLWTTAPRRCQNIDRTCRKKKSSCSVLSPWCAAGEAERSHTRHDSLPRTQATSSPSGFEPRSNSRVYGH